MGAGGTGAHRGPAANPTDDPGLTLFFDLSKEATSLPSSLVVMESPPILPPQIKWQSLNSPVVLSTPRTKVTHDFAHPQPQQRPNSEAEPEHPLPCNFQGTPSAPGREDSGA